jgi:hypothetical protein
MYQDVQNPMRGRRFSRLFLVFLTLLTLAWGSAGTALAQPYGGPDRDGGRGAGRDGVQPLDRLLPGIRRAHPGEFYDAEGPTYGPSGDAHYHLKWMTPEGRVIWFDADARNGRVLRSSPGRDSFDNNDRYRGPRSSGPQPFVDRYPPYTADPYDGGYGRRREQERNFGPPPGYGRPYRDWGGGRGEGRGGGRWRR